MAQLHYHIASQPAADRRAGYSDEESVDTSVRTFATPDEAMNLASLATYFIGSIDRLCESYSILPTDLRVGAVLLRMSDAARREQEDGRDMLVFPWACLGTTTFFRCTHAS